MSSIVHRVDCLEFMKAMDESSVDCVITDPPYEQQCHTQARRVKRGGGVEMLGIDFAQIDEATREECGRQFVRIAKRWIVIFCQVEATTTWAKAIEAGGGKYVRTGVWVKPDSMPKLTGDRPGMGYEAIVFGHTKGTGRMQWNGGGRDSVFVHNKNTPEFRQSRNPHPTTKPVPLMVELVDLFSNEGETVFDAFTGSGTTGIACARRGRNFIGCEMDERYHQLAQDRIAAEIAGTNLSAMRAGQVPMFGAIK